MTDQFLIQYRGELPKKRKRFGVVLTFRINALARMYYKMLGYNVPENYDFSKAVHPQERLMWDMAELAYEVIR